MLSNVPNSYFKRLLLVEEHRHNQNVKKWRSRFLAVLIAFLLLLGVVIAPHLLGYRLVFSKPGMIPLILSQKEVDEILDHKVSQGYRLKIIREKINKSQSRNKKTDIKTLQKN